MPLQKSLRVEPVVATTWSASSARVLDSAVVSTDWSSLITKLTLCPPTPPFALAALKAALNACCTLAPYAATGPDKSSVAPTTKAAPPPATVDPLAVAPPPPSPHPPPANP